MDIKETIKFLDSVANFDSGFSILDGSNQLIDLAQEMKKKYEFKVRACFISLFGPEWLGVALAANNHDLEAVLIKYQYLIRFIVSAGLSIQN